MRACRPVEGHGVFFHTMTVDFSCFILIILPASTVVFLLSDGLMMEIKCGVDGCMHDIEGLEACAPIPVSLDDADFAAYNRCLKFVRNLEVPNINCEPGKLDDCF